MAKTTKKKATQCGPSPDCSASGKRLQKSGSKIAAKAMNYVCKPQKQKRLAKGCLTGTDGLGACAPKKKATSKKTVRKNLIDVSSISQTAKAIRKSGEAWASAMKRAAAKFK